MSHHRIQSIILDEHTIVSRRPEVDHERAVAIADLIDENYFMPVGAEPGPYDLTLSVVDNRLLIDILCKTMKEPIKITLPLLPFRALIKDYFIICESYFDAIKNAHPSKIEAIDMGRRGIHNEGSEQLENTLKDRITMDFETARRLFTLVCVLHIK